MKLTRRKFLQQLSLIAGSIGLGIEIDRPDIYQTISNIDMDDNGIVHSYTYTDNLQSFAVSIHQSGEVVEVVNVIPRTLLNGP